jgi:hypothetical protein
MIFALLPDGRIFGQITQTGLKKYFLAGKNWWSENGRFCPKMAEKSGPKNLS